MSEPTPGPWEMERCEGWLINGVIHVPNHYEEYNADARLIAAAPELLDACRELVAAMFAYELDVEEDAPPTHRAMMARALAAIAKARGE